MTQTAAEKKKDLAHFKKGDYVQRAGLNFARIDAEGSYAGSLNTHQFNYPATFHDGSRGTLVRDATDEKIDPKKITVVMDAPKSRNIIPAFLAEWVEEQVNEGDFELEEPAAIEDGDHVGIAHVILAHKMAKDSFFLVGDLRIMEEPEEAAVLTVAELFND